MSSLNKVTLIGNLGNNPEIRSMNNGGKVCNLSIATSESWKDKATGEKREKAEWHRVVIFGDGLVNVCESYLNKGSKVYIEGQLQTRSWDDQEGNKKYTTEIVLQGFTGKLIMLDSKGSQSPSQHEQDKSNGYQPQPIDETEDEIPF